MQLSLAFSSALLSGLFGSVVAADEPQIVFKGRNYYAYGYEGDVTEGAPNG